MTMSKNTKVNAELELRPLEDHELETVNGGFFGSSLVDFAVGLAGGVVGAEAVAAGSYAADAKLPSMFQVFKH
jgi:hypothetical protein